MDPFWNQFFPDSSNPPDETSLQGWNQAPSIYQPNHPGASSGITLHQTIGSTVQASQSPNTASSAARVLKKSQSSLSAPDRSERKRQIDKDYRERVKINKMQMQLDFVNLTRENDSLKEENQSLKEDNASMNQTLTKQATMIDELRGDLLQLKRDHDKQNVLLETLTQYLADPLRIENETLKAENASLRKSGNLNGNVPQLLEEIAKLKLENKVGLAAAFLLDNMSFTGPSVGSGGRRAAFEFGKTHVVRPKGSHQATIVWLHGLGDNGSSWSQLLETLPLPNIKWICPTAPTRPISLFGGFPSTAWFDVGDLSEDAPDDVEGLDAAAAHVGNLLSTEPADIKLGIGGFSMGAATSLYSATCFVHGKYGNGNPYPANLSAVVGLSGWLPCSKTLKSKIGQEEAARRAASLPILLCHGKGDEVVPYKFGEKSSLALSSNGFQNSTFKSYDGLGHYTIPEEMEEVCGWLTSKLGLTG
ncbi:hypothetical protein GQ457_16G004190 [Hibiscus cannabinus]